MSTTTVTSKQYTLNLRDVLRGLLIAVITPVFTILGTSLNAGSLTFDWKTIGIVALGAALAYITKNFLTPSQIVVTNADPVSVKQVQAGTADVKVMTK
jgi:hypothetical protein